MQHDPSQAMSTTLHAAPGYVPNIRSVLIVDDDAGPRKILTRIMEDLGYTVVALASPESIEEEFTRRDFQLILLDIRLPGQSGLDVLKQLRTFHPLSMVIMVTAVFETETAVEAMKIGAVDYISKPFEIDAIIIAVQRANEIYNLRMENQLYKASLESAVQQRTRQLLELADELSRKNEEVSRTNQDLLLANQKLEAFLNHAMVVDKVSTIGLLSSMLLHGIANPLGVIQGIAEVLQRKYADNPTTVKELEMMQSYLHQILELVSQIRSYSKTEIIQFAPTDLTEVVANAAALFRSTAGKTGVQIATRFSEKPLCVMGNASQLQQVFVNLIQNALYAMERGGTVTVYDTRPDATKVSVIVEDTGRGIAPQHMDKIFKMFFTTRPDGKGTGLGLFICKEIVEKHGGDIRVENASPVGTRVILSFPIQLDES